MSGGRHEQRPRERPDQRAQHGGRHDRRHEEVAQRRDERQAAEVEQDERQGRELGSQRDTQRLAQPARRPTGGQPSDSCLGGPAQRQETGRGRQRELQADVGDHPGVGQQQTPTGQTERCRCVRGSPAFPGQQNDAAHHGRTDDAGLATGEHGVCSDGCHDEQASRPTPEARGSQQARGDAGHERDVPAADGHDVGQPRGREVVGHGPAHPLTQPDEDPRGEPGLGFRQGPSERTIDAPAHLLDDRPKTRAVRDERKRPCLDGPDRALARQEAREARRVGRRRLDPTFQRDLVARHQGRVSRQPRVDEPARGVVAPGSHLEEGPLLVA
jgi:hypothetical protein